MIDNGRRKRIKQTIHDRTKKMSGAITASMRTSELALGDLDAM
jgi:hypothetical protein